MEKHKDEPQTIKEAVALQRIFKCTRWSYRLNRSLLHGWSNHLRGDRAENFKTKGEAFHDLHERSFKLEEDRKKEFALAKDDLCEYFAKGNILIDYKSIEEVDERLKTALMQARSRVHTEPICGSLITYCRGKLTYLYL